MKIASNLAGLRRAAACLYRDERGYLLSAESVILGSVGIVGATVGLSSIRYSVNEELKEMAFSIRSLDQSYCIPQQSGCGAWTAGSTFIQQPVAESHRELQLLIEKQEQELQELHRERAGKDADDDHDEADDDDADDDDDDNKSKAQRKSDSKRKKEQDRERKSPRWDDKLD